MVIRRCTTAATALCFLLLPALGLAGDANRIGVTHVSGEYNFTAQDYLSEGADALAGLGARTIKVWAQHWQMQDSYPFNSTWPEVASLRELLQVPYMQALFDKPFRIYILEAFEVPNTYFLDGVDAAEYARVEQQFYDAARYLLETYQGTGKRFIFQMWEGDWAVRGHWDPNVDPTPEALAGMTAWLNARQDGVNRARAGFAGTGVEVYHAAEANLVRRAMEGHPSMANDVLPNTACDLYSYSAWDTLASPADLTAAIQYLRAKAPDSSAFGDNNVYLGEMGYAESWAGPDAALAAVQGIVGVAKQLDLPYAIYWQLYCNEPLHPLDPGQRPTNGDLHGFWLVRPDGTYSPIRGYLAGLYADDPNTWLGISASPREGGTVSGGGQYAPGATAVVTATARPGWGFLSWTGPVANPGSHTTTVRMDADKSVAATFVRTWFEDDDPALTYTGAWQSFSHRAASAGHAMRSAEEGARVTFAFAGTGVQWRAIVGPAMGRAWVAVDDAAPRLIDLFRRHSSARLFHIAGLPSGAHTLTIEVSGLKRRISGGRAVTVDALIVAP